MVWLAVPALITTEADLSSGALFSFAVIIIAPPPAVPDAGDTEHQLSARSLMTEALQLVEAVNETAILSPFSEITGLISVPAASSILSLLF